MQVFQIDDLKAQQILEARKITKVDLTVAINRFEIIENMPIGTLIGINDTGFFGSLHTDWSPDAANAREGLLIIPWVLIYELLNRVPRGTTNKFLSLKDKLH